MDWKKIIKCIKGLGIFLLLILIAILFSCSFLIRIDHKKSAKAPDTTIVKTNAQIDFVFENGNTITEKDFQNGIAIREFKVVNRSIKENEDEACYQLNFNIYNTSNYKSGDFIYSVIGATDSLDDDDTPITTATLSLPNFSSSIGMGSIKSGVTHEYRVIIKNERNVNIDELGFKLEINMTGNITYLLLNK